MHPLLELFINFAKKENIATDSFIVGGAVRDILLGKGLKDIDIAVKRDAINITKKFAREIDGSFVLLDKEFGIARIVKNSQFIDISIMRGNTIYDDLSERDITINAMAIPLLTVSSQQSAVSSLIDPLNGKDDLFNRIIRMVSEENLIKDPLRILRIYRFAASLNFPIEEDTLNTAERLAPLITSAAVERIAEELRYIVRLDDSYKTMKAMMDNKILVHIFPEVRINSLKLYKTTEETLSNPFDSMQPLIKYFETDYRKICLKLSTLFPDPDTAKQSAIRLKMSRKEVEFIHEMVLNRNKILDSYKEMQGMADETRIIRLLKEFRDDVYPLIILAIAQEPSITAFCKEVVSFYDNVFKPRAALLPIITGDDLINTFNLKPSPIFKEILAEIEYMILYGRISSKEEALKMIEVILKDKY
jgi:tRNA nucleotidyltransferase/poly(A) polymerase